MKKQILLFIEHYFYLCLMLPVIIALLYPHWFIPFKPTLSYILGSIMFINFLKIDTHTITHALRKSRRLLIWLILSQMIVVPLVLFWLVHYVDTDLAITVLLLAALPPAVSATALADLFKGNTTLTLILTVLSHMLVPFTLPALLWLCLGNSLTLPLHTITTSLVLVIFLPAVIAYFTKRWCAKTITICTPYFGVTVIVLLMALIAVAASLSAQYLPTNLLSLSWYFIFFLGLSLVFHLLGWLMSWNQPRTTIIASIISMNYNNIALGLLLAAQFFSPHVVLYTAIYEIVWNITLPISKLVFTRLEKMYPPTVHF